MGARIEAAVALTSHGMRKASARHLADAAAQACLKRAGREPRDVDLLINTGIYREDSLGEPALAALIQEDIGANLGHPPVGCHGTFSFDVANGTCGVINAIQVVSGFLRSGAIRLGLIVTSDVDPNSRSPRSAPFRAAGGALLLDWDDTIAGFTQFHAETFPEYGELFDSRLVWKPIRGLRALVGATGQSQVMFHEKPGYQARSVDCAELATRHFLDRIGTGVDQIDLLVPSPSSPEFLDNLRLRLGIPGDRVAYVTEDLSGGHTCGPIAALEAALKSGRLSESRSTVLIAAGAGITVALAHYLQGPPAAQDW
jgi:3-oxoacyl-[acyl-carrier-protein] synthase-3